MNAKDRKQVAALVSKLEDLKSQCESIGAEIRQLAEAEQEKFDNLSEGLQASERGQDMERSAEAMSTAADNCEAGDLDGALEELGNLSNDF